MSFIGYERKSYAWAAAADFTRAHKAKVAEVEEEVEWLTGKMYDHPKAHYAREDAEQRTIRRILAVEQTRLAELKKGLKS